MKPITGYFVLALLSLCFLSPPGRCADVSPEHRAKQRLAELRWRLPELCSTSLGGSPVYDDLGDKITRSRVTVCRCIGPAAAKLVIHYEEIDAKRLDVIADGYVIIFLQFYDGRWTTFRQERTGAADRLARQVEGLMVAIDEAAGQPAKNPGLEALCKRLPALLKQVKLDDRPVHERLAQLKFDGGTACRVAVCRCVSPTEAKLVLHYVEHYRWRQASFRREGQITIYLQFYDGCWTTIRRDLTGAAERQKAGVDLLMVAIDEAGGPPEKKK